MDSNQGEPSRLETGGREGLEMNGVQQPVIAGVDDTPGAWRAIDWAVAEAVWHRLPLSLLHAAPALVRDGSVSEYARARIADERTRLLFRARARVTRKAPEVTVRTSLLVEEPRKALVDAGRRAALIVLGSSRFGGWEGMVYGVVGPHVAAHARCPVLVVRAASLRPPDAPGSSGEIVVGVDRWDRSEQTVGWAFNEADARGAALRLVHATGRPHPLRGRWTHGGTEIAEGPALWQSKYPHVPVTFDVVAGSPAHALVTASRNADLVVVGRHRKGRAGATLGPTAHVVLHYSDCAVTVVPDG